MSMKPAKIEGPLPDSAPDARQPNPPADGARVSYRDTVDRISLSTTSNRGTPAYTRYISAPVARLLTAAAYRAGLTPNQLSLGGAALTMVAVLLIGLFRPSVAVGFACASLLLIAYVIDSADGQLARLLGGGTPAGEWLDHIIDSIKGPAIHAAVLISWFRFSPVHPHGVLLVPIAYGVESSVLFFSLMLTEQLRQAAASNVWGIDRTRLDRAPALRSLLLLPVDYGVLALSFFALGFGHPFVIVYSSLAALNVVFLFIALPRWYGQMAAINRIASRH